MENQKKKKLDKSDAQDAEVVETTPVTAVATVPSMSLNLRQFTPEEKTLIVEKKGEIDVHDEKSIRKFGAKEQSKIIELSKTVSSNVATRSAGITGDKVTGMLKSLRDAKPNRTFFGALIAPFKNKLQEAQAKMMSLDAAIQKVEEGLTSEIRTLEQNKATNKILFFACKEHYEELDILIAAVAEKINEARAELVEMVEEAGETPEPMKQHELLEYENNIQALERKLRNLAANQVEVNTQAIEIYQHTQSQIALRDKMEDVIKEVMPIVRRQGVHNVNLEDTRRINEVVNNITEGANQLIMENAKKTREVMTGVTKTVHDPTIKMETLKTVEKELTQGLKECLQIKKTAREKALKEVKELTTENSCFLQQISSTSGVIKSW